MAFLSAGGVSAGGAQGHELPPGDYSAPVSVECATFLGTKGSEVLSAGVFLPDGRILIAGICQNPEIALGGVQARVAGKDAPALPAQDAWKSLGVADSGKVAVPKIEDVAADDVDAGPAVRGADIRTDAEQAAEKKRKESEQARIAAIPNDLRWSLINEKNVEEAAAYRKFTWMDPECTAFWGVFSEDLKTVTGLWRLPRGAGSITAMGIAADGSVYIAGGASERIGGASADVRALPAVTESKLNMPYAVPMAYVAKLMPDLSGLAWVRTMPMDESAPKLRVVQGGDVVVSSPDIRRLSPAGELKLGSAVSRSRYPDSVSISPLTGGWCKGGDFMTRTGREPYRTPYFFIFNPDGTPYLELWRWRGAFVAVDALGHLVADAQVEKTCYDEQGNLVVAARSHGGNCVQLRLPWDITRMMTTLRANAANSPGCLVKISADYKFVGGGCFSDPGFFSRVEHGIDGSVVLFMYGAKGRTPNALSELADGRLIAVLSPAMDARRFSSAIPGAGQRLAIGGGTRKEDWSCATGWSAGKPKLLLLSGAAAEERIAGAVHTTPVKNAVQAEFAGGRLDGYAVLIDLSPGPAKPAAPPPAQKPAAAGAGKAGAKAEAKPERREPPPLMPAEGQRFEMGNVHWMTGHVDFREDPEGELWPRFYDARADAGDGFTVSLKGDSRVMFTMRAVTLQQADHNQERRLFGSRMRMAAGPDGKGEVPTPAVSLAIGRMSAWTVQTNRIERAQDVVLDTRAVCRVSGVLKIGGHAMPVENASCTARFTVPRGVDAGRAGVQPNYVCMNIRFKASGKEMGFADPDLAGRTIAVLCSCTGFAQVAYDELKKDAPPVPEMKDGAGDTGKTEL